MSDTFEIGDEFKIDYKRIYKESYAPNWKRCTDPNKTYIVHRLSKSFGQIYYIDNRTNIKCKCERCNSKINKYNIPEKDKSLGDKLKLIHASEIVLVKRKKQRHREIVLRNILRNID